MKNFFRGLAVLLLVWNVSTYAQGTPSGGEKSIDGIWVGVLTSAQCRPGEISVRIEHGKIKEGRVQGPRADGTLGSGMLDVNGAVVDEKGSLSIALGSGSRLGSLTFKKDDSFEGSIETANCGHRLISGKKKQ